ncbi:10409_t:CDS:2 [Entrophospora sp. SA101]|nr:10409_t:CDS:2 [Entrophospora sp. SA101]
MLNQNILKKYSIVTSNEPSSSIATPTTTINTYPANSYNQNNNVIFCQIPGCGKTFESMQKLKAHSKIHGEKNFKCEYPECGCEQAFNKKYNLLQHIKIVHLGIKSMCEYPGCGQTFTRKYSLLKHTKSQHEIKNFNCEYPGCGKTYACKDALQNHTISGHLEIKDLKCNYPQIGDENVNGNDLMMLNQNVTIATNNTNNNYNNCNTIDQSNHLEIEDLNRKYLEIGNENQSSNPEIKDLNKYSKIGNENLHDNDLMMLNQNIAVATNNNNNNDTMDQSNSVYACTFPGCCKSFRSRKSFSQHGVIHGERKFRCDYAGCTRSFYRKDILLQHIRAHLGIRNYKCDTDGCEKKFSRKFALDKHKTGVHKNLST